IQIDPCLANLGFTTVDADAHSLEVEICRGTGLPIGEVDKERPREQVGIVVEARNLEGNIGVIFVDQVRNTEQQETTLANSGVKVLRYLAGAERPIVYGKKADHALPESIA